VTRWKTVEYCDLVDGECLTQIRFHKDSLELELHDPGFENGISMVVFPPGVIPGHGVCWQEWIYIEEDDERYFDEMNCSEPFGWWMV
jgi:hypothetical protein